MLPVQLRRPRHRGDERGGAGRNALVWIAPPSLSTRVTSDVTIHDPGHRGFGRCFSPSSALSRCTRTRRAPSTAGSSVRRCDTRACKRGRVVAGTYQEQRQPLARPTFCDPAGRLRRQTPPESASDRPRTTSKPTCSGWSSLARETRAPRTSDGRCSPLTSAARTPGEGGQGQRTRETRSSDVSTTSGQPALAGVGLPEDRGRP